MTTSETRTPTTLTTLLNVRRGAEAIDFYTRAFGATIVSRMDAPDGSVVAHPAIGNGDFWLADESAPHQNFSPESLDGGTVRMVLVVEDPDAMFARAISAGAKVVQPMEDQPYGWHVGRVVDPFGHHWEIGKPLAS